MDQAPLVKDDLLAGAELVRRFAERRPLKAAFWLREKDDYRASLYLAVEGLENMYTGPVYDEVFDAAKDLNDPYSEPLDLRVKLISAKNPMSQAAIEFNQNYSDPVGSRLRGTMFGDVFAEEVFIYPTSIPAVVE